MQIPQIDSLHAEALQASVARCARVFGPSVDAPLLRLLASGDEAKLGREHRLRAPALQGAPNQPLVLVRTVDVGGVEEVCADVERAVDRRDRLLLVALRTLAVALAHAHAAEADRKELRAVAAEFAVHGD